MIAQQNSIEIKATLDDAKSQLNIQQKIVYYNTSDQELESVFLHNWPNSFKNRNTALSKRFIEAYQKNLYFAKKEELGATDIKNISVNFEAADYRTLEKQIDILEIPLKETLKQNDSIIINATYSVKIPNAKFTNYGKTKTGYQLRYWYLNPAVHEQQGLNTNIEADILFLFFRNL